MSEITDLVEDYHNRVQIVAAATADAANALWTEIGGLTDLEQQQFATQIAPLVGSAQQVVSQITATYAAQAVSTMTGEIVQPITPDLSDLRNGTPLVEVYKRPTVVARVGISKGLSFTEAMALGGARASLLADTDVMLSHRKSAYDSFTGFPQVIGYRRVPNVGACEFCQVASVQRYQVRDLAALHPNCRCGVVPIIGFQDPGQIINRTLYDRLRKDGAMARITEAKDRIRAKNEANRLRDAITRSTEHRDEALRRVSEATTKRDKTRLQARADKWQREIDQDSTRLAELSTGVTPVVKQHPELGPVLAAK